MDTTFRCASRRGLQCKSFVGSLVPLFVPLVLTLGCGDLAKLAGTQSLPAGTQGPSTYNTAAGAMALYTTAIATFRPLLTTQSTDHDLGALVNAVRVAGVLADELQAGNLGSSQADPAEEIDSLDARLPSDGFLTQTVYSQLQGIRGTGTLAIGALAAYAVTAPPALRGRLYAQIGYAEILLADLFCSGVPLSTIDFHGDYTYHASSTTEDVYRDANAKFDSALALSGDSVAIQSFAWMGKGRAYLDRGLYDSAAAAVAHVPEGFSYQFPVNWGNAGPSKGFWMDVGSSDGVTVADQEGETGLAYRSGGDPRTAVQAGDPNVFGLVQYYPLKYGGNTPGILPLTVADWIEARLIQAESALQHGDIVTWLATLNRLRTDGTGVTVQDTVADTLGVTDCSNICGHDPGNGIGGSTPDFGQPAGGFPIPAGYSFAGRSTTYPAPPGIQDYCSNNSWYTPCYVEDTMVVNLYVSPPRTQWNPGTGGVGGLGPLTDPGSTLSGAAADSARVDVLFRERAAWLFLTGHRLGDLRRLVRNYGRAPNAVFPIGAYPRGTTLFQYGAAASAKIPSTELVNHNFHGCLSQGAQ